MNEAELVTAARQGSVARAKGADGNQKSAVVSPDGKFRYVNGTHNESSTDKDGNPQLLQTPLGLQVIRTADAVRTAQFDTAPNDLALSADGKFAYLHTWETSGPVTDVLDIQQGRVVASLPDTLLTPTRRLNGDPLLVSGYDANYLNTALAVFKPGTTQPLSKWPAPDYAEWIIIPQ